MNIIVHKISLLLSGIALIIMMFIARFLQALITTVPFCLGIIGSLSWFGISAFTLRIEENKQSV